MFSGNRNPLQAGGVRPFCRKGRVHVPLPSGVCHGSVSRVRSITFPARMTSLLSTAGTAVTHVNLSKVLL